MVLGGKSRVLADVLQFTMRGDKTFAYDLVISDGAVNSRVVLLLRSIEAKPR